MRHFQVHFLIVVNLAYHKIHHFKVYDSELGTFLKNE